MMDSQVSGEEALVTVVSISIDIMYFVLHSLSAAFKHSYTLYPMFLCARILIHKDLYAY